MYYARSNKHVATIGDRQILVDSNLEESVLLWLEKNGFKDRWRRRENGIHVGKNNYTPDLELSVEYAGTLHRALVEIKPAKDAFTPYISRRMRGIAPHYHTQLMLLYADKEKSWFKIDIKSGQLTEIGLPIPGKRKIKAIPGVLVIPAPKIYSHTYIGKPNLLKATIQAGLDAIQTVIVGPKKAKKINKTTRQRGRR